VSNKGRVALDALLELGEGERVGAAAVLAELISLDPELLSEALVMGCKGDPKLFSQATHLAGPWIQIRATQETWVRRDVLRSPHIVGGVIRSEGRPVVYRAFLTLEEGTFELGAFPDSAAARQNVDTQLVGWRLLD
jgi:hypothetical protein